MHKSKIAVLFLASTLFLSTITSMSTQVFAYEREDYDDDRQYYSENEESEYIEYNEYNYDEPLYSQDYKEKKSYSEYDNQYSKKPKG